MYPDTGLVFPYFQSFSPDVEQYFDFSSYSPKSNPCMGNVNQSSKISDYDLGGEGDLFKAPEPIMEEPAAITVDPMTAAMAMISCGEDELRAEEVNEEFLSNVFHEFQEILEKQTVEEGKRNENCYSVVKENVHPPGQIQKSMSSDCLGSMDRVGGGPIEHGFPDITQVDFGSVYGMRRAYSDGDIKTLANGNGNHRHSSLVQPLSMSDHITEDRWQKLSRYRIKKAKRNFGRKIKYACRKALADSQPRIRGRFAKTEESEIWKK